ncbi:DegT/DnrJ/EryC1/StrS family aminotransferase [Cytophaga hutchinsonii]|jgi:pyridoxal phosphate-dependent aminotransferase EpsN|uniref:Cell wall biosynthesis enzyme n=1 Tax=Cytophaga hutchinsonii (strain ATCC 33406 / DSM 1761 / CIP 103989 / NBRC 15051 / NCIMB 9469 / D465) TaxID=269798 RepID=A0A6N4SQ92_CYTH3|nr:aminotransferase class I/II-fold pyridoxal phosphate-dependent enzyme [Cytophaga hutchinsonii]ABG58486.1 cell wall biosynthesis enzyme [Cytophaga hutchinsonii ATCC 33406]SFX75471.1 DegT/DnrJ/EryC1/StrS aminotransferase family protein [Cytophaga hutchinsonii ATCC 33406]
MQKRVYLSPPDLSGNEFRYIQEALESNWIAPFGPQLDSFTELLQTQTGTSFAVPVNSGTSAIHLALLALHIQEGDLVFCPTFTFAASIFPVLYQRATPVFIDSESHSWNMDPVLLEQAILDSIENKQKPKAIILVHIYGFPAMLDQIQAIAAKYHLYLIEDAAEALGSSYKNKALGSFGHAGALSFNGNKLVTGGTGGAVITNDEELFNEVRVLANQAKEEKPYYEHLQVGYNYRMCNLNAAVACAQLEQLGQKINKKKQIRAWYAIHLSGAANIKQADAGIDNAWLTCVEFASAESPEKVRLALEEENIESRNVWNPMHRQPVFKDCTAYLNGVSDAVFANSLCLPSGTQLIEKDIIHITDIIKRSL